MARPTEVAGEDDSKESGFIDHFQGLTYWEVELWEEVLLLREIKWDDLGFLVVNSHFIHLSEDSKIIELVLEDRLINRERQARDFMEVWGTNYWDSGN